MPLIFRTVQSDLWVHDRKPIKSYQIKSHEENFDWEEVGEMFDIELADGTKLEVYDDEIVEEGSDHDLKYPNVPNDTILLSERLKAT